MKQLLIAVTLAMLAGIASAQIWSETFSTSSPPSFVIDGGAQVTNEVLQGQWTSYQTGVGPVITSDSSLRLPVNNWAGQEGFTVAASIALDESLFSGAGLHRVTLDIAAIQTDAILGVRIYNASIGSGGTNNYYRMVNYGWGVGNPCYTDAPVLSDASAILLVDGFFNSSHKGVRSLDFTYDGDGDVVVQIMAMSETASQNRWVEINEVSVDSASANAAVPSFLDATNVVTGDLATQNVAYTNDTFVTDATINPDVELLTYSAKTNLAPGLTVSSDGTISGTPLQGGTNTMIISVADAEGAYDEAVFILVVENQNDAPFFYSPPAYGDNIFWAGNGLVDFPYSADLNNYVGDPDGDELTFSGSGPSWLTIASDGIFSGTPGADDYLQNSFEIIASDGSLSATGTLNIAVEKRSIIHYDDFPSNAPPTVTSVGTAQYPIAATNTTTQTSGIWYGGGWYAGYNASRQALQFARPNETAGGAGGVSIMLDESLFVDGAATYQIRYRVTRITGAAPVYTQAYDVDYGAGSVLVGNYSWGVATLPAVVATNGAVATQLVSTSSSATGFRTVEFDYDGTGHVLLRFGCGKGNKDWWVITIDNLKLLGPDQVTPLQTWALQNYGLRGADAAAENNPNGDAWPLLYDYALGLNPFDGTPDGGAVPTVEMVGSDMVYVHALRTNDPSLVYSIETNPNLVNSGGWSSADYVTGINVTTGEYNYVTNTIPATDPELFIRLKVDE